VYNKLAIVRHYNNNNRSLKSFKKQRKLRQAKQLVIVSFNLKLRGVLSGRRVRRRLESRKLQRKLKGSIVEASATLLKLYNYPN
jgi:hypothetical protein